MFTLKSQRSRVWKACLKAKIFLVFRRIFQVEWLKTAIKDIYYIRATEPHAHVINAPTEQEDIHMRCQKEMNAHSTMWVRLLKAWKYTSTNERNT